MSLFHTVQCHWTMLDELDPDWFGLLTLPLSHMMSHHKHASGLLNSQHIFASRTSKHLVGTRTRAHTHTHHLIACIKYYVTHYFWKDLVDNRDKGEIWDLTESPASSSRHSHGVHSDDTVWLAEEHPLHLISNNCMFCCNCVWFSTLASKTECKVHRKPYEHPI